MKTTHALVPLQRVFKTGPFFGVLLHYGHVILELVLPRWMNQAESLSQKCFLSVKANLKEPSC
jgi:hypothetical protein